MFINKLKMKTLINNPTTFCIVWAVFIGIILGKINCVHVHNLGWWVLLVILNGLGGIIFYSLNKH